jgi:hypothetical protein
MLNLSPKVFLSRDDAVFIASEGDIVDRRCKIVRVNSNSIEVDDLMEKTRHTLSLSPG